MFQAFQELFERLGLKRTRGRRSFELEAELHDALVERADIEKRGADDLAAELVTTGLKWRLNCGSSIGKMHKIFQFTALFLPPPWDRSLYPRGGIYFYGPKCYPAAMITLTGTKTSPFPLPAAEAANCDLRRSFNRTARRLDLCPRSGYLALEHFLFLRGAGGGQCGGAPERAGYR